MKRAVFVTGHVLDSRRQAGFHFIARAFHRAGWEVLFFTAALSPFSWLTGDYRIADPPEFYNRPVEAETGLTAWRWVTPFHPVNLRRDWLNAAAAPLFRRYGRLPLGSARAYFAEADLVVFESFAGMLLFERIRRLNPDARLVYRVSDDMRWLNLHPVCLEAESAAAPHFHLISCPSPPIHRRFAHLPSARLHPHGIDKALFDRETRNPYPGRSRNAVFCGAAHLDHRALATAADALPDWRFHVIGPFPKLPRRPNIAGYGEMAMADTVRYVKFADLGLNLLLPRPHGEALTDTLKMRQYTYCRLPIVAPATADYGDQPHVHTYRSDQPGSVAAAIERALATDRQKIPADRVDGWEYFVPSFSG